VTVTVTVTVTGEAGGEPASGRVMIGTAGWSIPRAMAGAFAGTGSHLERYARRLPAVEINSSFYRSHRPATYRRWADAVPPAFRFAIKLPKTISHGRRLVDAGDLLEAFAAETAGLGEKLGVLLLQLPPSFAFDAAVLEAFVAELRHHLRAPVACEPRHASWFTDAADACLADNRVARVMAHPVLAAGGERPGGWQGLHYHRLHGAPRMYYSPYDPACLDALARQLVTAAVAERWCIFDNTASGAATSDAIALRRLIGG
jgi:uncharacterized protein YecE (DUF72 family)